MIEHQVHSNAFTFLPEYGQLDCGFSHLETSKDIYGCFDVAADPEARVRLTALPEKK
jgi:hypothetical protein